MPDSENDVQGGLTWKILKQVFPVAPSLRRDHWDLLDGIGIAYAQRNDDELFYEALLHKFRADAEFVIEFDARFLGSKKKKDRERSFFNRAMKWLDRRVPTLPDYEEFSDAPAGLFGEATPERELRDMILELQRAAERAEASLAPRIEQTWKAAAAELRSLLGESDRPTPEAVERIEAAVRMLLEIGREYGKLTAEAERRRAEIRAALEPVADRDCAVAILERLESLDSGRLANLARMAAEVKEHIDALAKAETGLAEKAADFERLRSEGAAWAAVARQAETLAGLEADKNRRHKAVDTALARMAAAVEPPPEDTAVKPPVEAAPAIRPRRPARADAAAEEVKAAEPAKSAEPPPPASWEEFASWCDERLNGRLALSPRARGSIKKARYEDVGLAAQCLAWLGGDYRRARLEGRGNSLQGPVPAGSGVRNDRCGGDSFEFDWQGKRLWADWHIKSGDNTRDPARCLRIYYCWHEDGDGGQVVVGDMPAHVRSRVT